MRLDKADAEMSLMDIRRSEERSAILYAYSRLAPYLLVAGLLWMLADLGLRFGTRLVQLWAWPTALLVAMPLFVAIAIAQSRRRSNVAERRDRLFPRSTGIWMLSIAFLLALVAILAPDGKEVHGLMGLVTGFAFATIGLWVGWRLLATGIAIGALTVISHVFFGPGDNILFMGLVGGGGMLVGAWWLSRV